MKKLMFAVFAASLFSMSAHATDWVTVPDMSRLSWQMAQNGTVFFRNLNEFDSRFLPCCYNYWLDTTTAGGKVAWAVMLTKMASKERLILGVDSAGSQGAITYNGLW